MLLPTHKVPMNLEFELKYFFPEPGHVANFGSNCAYCLLVTNGHMLLGHMQVCEEVTVRMGEATVLSGKPRHAFASDSWIKDNDKNKPRICHSKHGHPAGWAVGGRRHAKQGDDAANGVLCRPRLHEGPHASELPVPTFL